MAFATSRWYAAAQKVTDGRIMPPKLDKDSPTGRISVTAPESFLERVEEWRARQRPVPTKAEAMRMLAERQLDAEEAANSKRKR